jgi:hypothetical protein
LGLGLVQAVEDVCNTGEIANRFLLVHVRELLASCLVAPTYQHANHPLLVVGPAIRV